MPNKSLPTNENPIKFQIEGARIIYRNFGGAATPFKQKGTRTFAVVLPKKLADDMSLDGWNVKCKPAQEEGEEEFCFIEITLKYNFKPPRVVVITDTSKTDLTEDTVGMLDWAEMRNIDLIARSYFWEMPSGASGIKAMLQSMYVTIEEDPLERKYNMLGGDPELHG